MHVLVWRTYSRRVYTYPCVLELVQGQRLGLQLHGRHPPPPCSPHLHLSGLETPDRTYTCTQYVRGSERRTYARAVLLACDCERVPLCCGVGPRRGRRYIYGYTLPPARVSRCDGGGLAHTWRRACGSHVACSSPRARPSSIESVRPSEVAVCGISRRTRRAVSRVATGRRPTGARQVGVLHGQAGSDRRRPVHVFPFVSTGLISRD